MSHSYFIITVKITVRRSSEENMWERLRRGDSPSRLAEASYESYRCESTDFSRAIFPRSLASRTRARIILCPASIHVLDDMQERDKDKRDSARPTGLTDDPP